MRKNKIIIFLIGTILYIFSQIAVEKVYAKETETGITIEYFMDQSDYEEMQRILDENLVGVDFQIDTFIRKIWKGEIELSGTAIMTEIQSQLRQELENNRTLWLQCFLVVVAAGIFTNFSMIFKNGQVGETGFYISYLFLFTILLGAFYSIFILAERSVSLLLLFMKALLPVYFLMVAGTSGAGVATPMYQTSLCVIGALEVIIGKVLLPAIEIFFILSLINQFSKEDRLSKLTEFLESTIRWGLKGTMGIVLGLHSIETMLLPAIGKVKENAIVKTGSAIPVFGETFESVAETVYGVASLLKNAVGVTGIIGILLLCATPVLKMFVYTLVYKTGAAILQPISEKRIWNCLNSVASTSGLLLYLELMCVLLLCITIIILAKGTG